MWPRYGSFPGFNPIVELSLTFHNLVVGANGQRQAMFLENVSGLAERILRNFDLSTEDAALVISSSGCNVVPIEMAEQFQRTRREGRRDRQPRALRGEPKQSTPRGKKLQDFADLVLDTGAPAGDAMVQDRRPRHAGRRRARPSAAACWSTRSRRKSPTRLTAAGQPPKVLSGAAVVGAEQREASCSKPPTTSTPGGWRSCTRTSAKDSK